MYGFTQPLRMKKVPYRSIRRSYPEHEMLERRLRLAPLLRRVLDPAAAAAAEAHALDAARPRAPTRGTLPSRRRDGRQLSSSASWRAAPGRAAAFEDAAASRWRVRRPLLLACAVRCPPRPGANPQPSPHCNCLARCGRRPLAPLHFVLQ